MRDDLFDVHAEIEERHWWFVARREIVGRLLARVWPADEPGVLLDIGCGTGANVAVLGAGREAVGLDPHAEGVTHARRRFDGPRFVVGATPEDVADLLPRVRVALLMDVIEHLPDDFEAVSTWLEALPAGAHLLVTVPSDPALWSKHDEVFGHYRRYTAPRLARVWEGLAVTCRLHSHFNARLYPVVKAVRAWRRWTGGTERGDDFKLGHPLVNERLRRVFAGEARPLLRALDGAARGYGRGVSQVALLRREAGPLAARRRPAEVAPDAHDPTPTQAEAGARV